MSKAICTPCRGQGVLENSQGDFKTCPVCNGTGTHEFQKSASQEEPFHKSDN